MHYVFHVVTMALAWRPYIFLLLTDESPYTLVHSSPQSHPLRRQATRGHRSIKRRIYSRALSPTRSSNRSPLLSHLIRCDRLLARPFSKRQCALIGHSGMVHKCIFPKRACDGGVTALATGLLATISSRVEACAGTGSARVR